MIQVTQVTHRVHLLSSSVHHQVNVLLLTNNVTETATVLTALTKTTAVSHACLYSLLSQCRSVTIFFLNLKKIKVNKNSPRTEAAYSLCHFSMYSIFHVFIL